MHTGSQHSARTDGMDARIRVFFVVLSLVILGDKLVYFNYVYRGPPIGAVW